MPETFYEEFASIIEACVIEEEIATDHGVRNKVATNMTSRSDDVGPFPTPILETSTVGHVSPKRRKVAAAKRATKTTTRKTMASRLSPHPF